MNIPTLMPVHGRLQVGALASVFRIHGLGNSPQADPDTFGSNNYCKQPLHMELDDSSMISTPPEKEPVMECSLMLTTLSGETFQVSLSVAKFDRFEDPEDQVLDYLVSVLISKSLGAALTFCKLPHRLT